MSMSFVEMREQATEPVTPRRRSSRLSNRISFTQDEFSQKKDEDERARRGSFPDICEDECLHRRNEYRQLLQYAKFKPQLYFFEIDDYHDMMGMVHSESQQNNLQIQCPDFHILADHTIAMIWFFYKDKKYWKKFTIPQIEWTLKFIDAIKSTTGMPFTDMDTIKTHLEEFLFMCYSEVDAKKFTEPAPPVAPPKKCVQPGYKENDIPFSLRELFHNDPAMLTNVLGPPPSHMMHDVELPPNETLTKALIKLEEFEWKNIQRINDEIDMFELIKCIKTQIGTHHDKVTARDLSHLKEKIGLLENKWALHTYPVFLILFYVLSLSLLMFAALKVALRGHC